MVHLIDKDALVAEIEKTYNFHEKRGNIHDASICDVLYGLLHRINTLEIKEVDKKSETAYRSKIIKVKCISPFDETWEKGKVYICEKWHHGDLNIEFWDVYYDYDNNPKYVQFSSIEMLEKEFAILKNDTIEVKEVDLEKEIDNIWNPRFELGWDEKSLLSMNHEGFITIAKHFFKLGMQVSNKAHKGEKI